MSESTATVAKSDQVSVYLPDGWRDAMMESLSEGEKLSEFIREALRREIRRRNKADVRDLPDMEPPGRRWPSEN